MQIFVLGMHRSGTSVVTRLINLMGAYFGPQSASTGANPENPKGFWERRDVRNENDALLWSARADWWKVADFSLERVPDDAVNRFDNNVRRILRDLEAHRPWVVKEPRFCLLFPMWRRHVEAPVCVLVHRSPVQVAHSLQHRNGFPLSFGVALWERYVLDALSGTVDLPRIIVSYEEIMAAPVRQMDQLRQELTDVGISGLRRLSKTEITSFLSSDLFRQRQPAELESGFLNRRQLELANAMSNGAVLDLEEVPTLSNEAKSILCLYEDLCSSYGDSRSSSVETEKAIKAQNDLARALADRNGLFERVTEMQHENDELRSIIESSENKLDRTRRTSRSRVRKLKQLEEEINTANTRIRDLENQVQRLHDAERARDRAAARAAELEISVRRTEHEAAEWREKAAKSASRQQDLENWTETLLTFLRRAQEHFEHIRAKPAWRIGPWEVRSLRNTRTLQKHLEDLFREVGRWVRERRNELVAIIKGDDATAAEHVISEPWRSTDFSGVRQIDIDVIVCVHDSLDEVRKCFNSVISTLESHHTLIIVDDGSGEETAQFLRDFAAAHDEVKLIRQDHACGYTRAANCGIKSSTAEFVILLNSDTQVAKGWWAKLARAAYQAPDIGIVGPLSNAASWQSVPDIVGKDGRLAVNPLPSGLTVEDMDRIAETCSFESFPSVGLVNGFCLAVKRQVFETIGLFDEESFPRGYGEENDFCFRAADAGFDIMIATDCYIYHEKSASYSSATRDRLAKETAAILHKKYPGTRIRRAVEACKQNPVLVEIRDRFREEIEKAVELAKSKPTEGRGKPGSPPPRILFVLPVKGGGGGVHSIVQETMGIRELGAHASVAVPQKALSRYHEHYPNVDRSVFVGFRNIEELKSAAEQYDVIVATIFTSVKLIKKVLRSVPDVLPAYYIQDYEPWICRDNESLRQEALNSYTLIPGLVRFAKTDWIRQTVEERHGVPVHKVMPSLDTSVYFPLPRNASSGKTDQPVRIAAMVRPKTPRRAAGLTMEVLGTIKEEYGESVEITVFGCDPQEKGFLALRHDFEHRHLGVLIREEVAETLRQSNIFVDFSTYQAFGRTALEAMACGCAVIVPEHGGASEYAENGVNALVVDTSDHAACIAATRRLIDDRTLRERLGKKALSTAGRYNVRGAAESILTVLAESAPRKLNESPPTV
jgi:GT2 family glycosyltransferase/glycosyltransferase involved in cell wall biosynthesis